MKPAIFLDRDGVINRLIIERGPRETPVSIGEFELIARVPEAIARLRMAGFLLIVVTNQPNVAKGKCGWSDLKQISDRMKSFLPQIDAEYACLHHPDPKQVVRPDFLSDCQCRKPKPGLILQAVRDFPIDLEKSWLIGDSVTDIEAGLAAGIDPTRLILIGESSSITKNVATDLWSATTYLLEVTK